jgi:hypothetical protein
MSTNITFVLMYHRHKLLHLIDTINILNYDLKNFTKQYCLLSIKMLGVNYRPIITTTVQAR